MTFGHSCQSVFWQNIIQKAAFRYNVFNKNKQESEVEGFVSLVPLFLALCLALPAVPVDLYQIWMKPQVGTFIWQLWKSTRPFHCSVQHHKLVFRHIIISTSPSRPRYFTQNYRSPPYISVTYVIYMVSMEIGAMRHHCDQFKSSCLLNLVIWQRNCFPAH